MARVQDRDCGCVEGAIAAVSGMTAYAWYVGSGHAAQYGRTEKIFIGGAVFLVSALLGKAFGMLLARFRRTMRGRALSEAGQVRRAWGVKR